MTTSWGEENKTWHDTLSFHDNIHFPTHIWWQVERYRDKPSRFNKPLKGENTFVTIVDINIFQGYSFTRWHFWSLFWKRQVNICIWILHLVTCLIEEIFNCPSDVNKIITLNNFRSNIVKVNKDKRQQNFSWEHGVVKIRTWIPGGRPMPTWTCNLFGRAMQILTFMKSIIISLSWCYHFRSESLNQCKFQCSNVGLWIMSELIG